MKAVGIAFVVGWSCFFSGGCLAQEHTIEAQNDLVWSVSLVNLLANPTAYYARRVEVFGFYGGRAGNVLFLGRDNQQYFDYASGIRVHFSDLASDEATVLCRCCFVKITGKFVLQDNVSMLTNIEKFHPVEENYSKNCGFEDGDAVPETH